LSLSRVAFVLERPKDIVNIGGVVRVMKNFGLGDLRLVEPDEFDPYRLEGIAHRGSDLIEAATIHHTLDEAVADATFIVGTTARARTAGRSYTRPRHVASTIAARAASGPGPCAVLFGREDRGLTNEALDRCHGVTIIPTDPAYSSLNLAQAALVLAYEIFLALEGPNGELPTGKRATRPPTQEELEETFRAIASGLARIDFYKARKPEAVMRTLRTIITRAEPDLREARLLAAVGYEIANYLDRMQQS
jgi:tRNA/rRNA methyltransferase